MLSPLNIAFTTATCDSFVRRGIRAHNREKVILCGEFIKNIGLAVLAASAFNLTVPVAVGVFVGASLLLKALKKQLEISLGKDSVFAKAVGATDRLLRIAFNIMAVVIALKIFNAASLLSKEPFLREALLTAQIAGFVFYGMKDLFATAFHLTDDSGYNYWMTLKLP